MQSRFESFIEANVGTWTGFVGSFLINLACYKWALPIMGLVATTTLATVLCTVWSLIRGYYVRRFFNARHARSALQYTHGIQTTAKRTR